MASQRAGIEVSIAAPRCAPADVESFLSRAGSVDLRLFSAFGANAFITSPALIKWVRHAAKAYDIVHVHGLFNPTSSLSARLALASTTTVLRPFGTLSRYTFQHRRTALKKAYITLLERRTLRRAAALHFTTERERSEANWHGVDFSGRAYVIPPPSLAPAGGTRARGNEAVGNRVVFLGRINPVKNLECLLDAWAIVRRRVPTAQLEIAGDGEPVYVATLKLHASRAGIADSVAFVGFVSGTEKSNLLASAGVVVLPSHHENFGIAVLEAVETGVPVIVSPEVHLADFVREHGVGRITQPDAHSLSDAIVDVLCDPRIQQSVRNRGAGIVAEHFSPTAIGELLSKMYREAIDRIPYGGRQ